jgi:shikimate dehydrogenase
VNDIVPMHTDIAASAPCGGIDGRTTLIGIVADPIGQVRTPGALNALLAARGVNAVVVPLHVGRTDLTEAVRACSRIRNMAGLVVTMPYQESIVGLCADLTEAARQAGAVNLVRFTHDRHATIVGTNLDGEGFIGGLQAQGHGLAGRRVFLAGAGGPARAIAHALAAQGVESIGIYHHNYKRAVQLAQALTCRHPNLLAFPAPQIPSTYDIAINATPFGLTADDPTPFQVYALPPHAIVADTVIQVEQTPLLAAADRRGLRVHTGRHMLDGQVHEMGRFLGLF